MRHWARESLVHCHTLSQSLRITFSALRQRLSWDTGNLCLLDALHGCEQSVWRIHFADKSIGSGIQGSFTCFSPGTQDDQMQPWTYSP